LKDDTSHKGNATGNAKKPGVFKDMKTKTFFGTFLVKPTSESEHFKTLKSVYVNTWVVAEDSEQADAAAVKNIIDTRWEVVSSEEKMRETTIEDCPSQEATLQFQKAQIYGVSAFFVACGVDSSGKDYSFN
jgi:hypothetical protein